MRMLEKDLRVLIHDLRNRIAPIRNATYLLQLRAGTDPQLRDTTALIERQLQAMAELLDAASPKQAAADPAPVQAAVGAQQAPAAPRVRKILIADDSPAVCDSL